MSWVLLFGDMLLEIHIPLTLNYRSQDSLGMRKLASNFTSNSRWIKCITKLLSSVFQESCLVSPGSGILLIYESEAQGRRSGNFNSVLVIFSSSLSLSPAPPQNLNYYSSCISCYTTFIPFSCGIIQHKCLATATTFPRPKTVSYSQGNLFSILNVAIKCDSLPALFVQGHLV